MKRTAEFFNRELSWIEFNKRVVDLGKRKDVPLLERLKFLAIVSSNFDEFFMVRVANAKHLAGTQPEYRCPSGMSSARQLEAVRRNIRTVVAEQYQVFNTEILPALEEAGIRHVSIPQADRETRDTLEHYFKEHILPVVSPVRIDNDTPPHISGDRQHIGFQLVCQETGETHYAVVSVPVKQERFFWHKKADGDARYTPTEEIITTFGAALFPGYTINGSARFRITREADMNVDEQRDEDFMDAMEEVLIHRTRSAPIRMEYAGKDGDMIRHLAGVFGVDAEDLYPVDGPLNLKGFFAFLDLPGFPGLKYPGWESTEVPYRGEDLLSLLKERDLLLHHPYQSFSTVEDLIRFAAEDPQVLSIKMTLYRTSGGSPIVAALRNAALNGKHVTVFVELKARFDEKQNLSWATHLETAGVIVVYGIAHLKVHAKMLIIIRKEYEGIRRYVHLSTGNYNESTAKQYTDLALLSSRDSFTAEAAMIFNAITGYSSVPGLTNLSMAPTGLKHRLLQIIRREEEKHTPQNPGHIRARLNSLADPQVIRALYKASSKGVRIELNVRGICMLIPGVKGLSENIKVVSIVDRYLEHSRILHVANGGSEEIYLSSADWMPRNLDRRVEILFPVEGQVQRQRIKRILDLAFSDTANAYALTSDGTYERIKPAKGEAPLRSQEQLWKETHGRAQKHEPAAGGDFSVRRTPPGESQ
ncbi:MAG: polyphosphate kinase 1 [Spirochaetales bacterium]|nr:polyphosphate kinase 1 [Spirochaetales bacterium]